MLESETTRLIIPKKVSRARAWESFAIMAATASSDNRYANSNEISPSDDNCFAEKLSIAACAAEQFYLRRCRSDCSVPKIDEMGARIGRSKSFESLNTDSIVYKKVVKKDEKSLNSFEDSEDDYKLLDSSGDESDGGSDTDDNHCATDIIEPICDGHDSPEIATNNCNGNEIENDLLCEKYSTLPRVKTKNGNVDHEAFARHSAPYKSADCRPHCSKENMSKEIVDTKASDVLTNDDKAADFSSFRSTTLPKTRSRLSEPYSRHSLRRAIDLTISRKHFSNASDHRALIIPGNESSSGTGKNV